MPRARVKVSPAPETPPDWWGEQFHHRQQRARLLVIRSLGKAGRPLANSEMLNYTSSYSRREFLHAIDALVASGQVRRFVRHEPFSVAFGQMHHLVDRTYYELTEQPACPPRSDGAAP